MISDRRVLEALPVAVYITDAEGRITFYNEAAAAFWGYRPELGSAQWCGSWRLFWPDGRPMAHDECPMAIALKGGRAVTGDEAIAERPDGTRVPFASYPSPLKDESGRVIGGVNLLIDIAARKDGELATQRLAAIVSSSDDAIVSKTLDGIVTSWNTGASRIFGYEPEEMIGRSIKTIIPPDLQGEEDEILAKLRRGERIDHFDTIRMAKDGRLIAVSLTVSPIRDRTGRVIGASKVARDFTERKRNEDLQRLLFDELNHRVKNTLASIQAIASQSMRNAAKPSDFVSSFNGRVQALARAHDLLVQGKMQGTTLHELIREQVVLGAVDGARISYAGPEVTLDARIAVQLALVLHELATNARKYGALSVPGGQLTIRWKLDVGTGRELYLRWVESGVPKIAAPRSRGFGSTLIERSLEANQGTAAIRYGSDGIICEIGLPLPQEISLLKASGVAAPWRRAIGEKPVKSAAADLNGKRILLVEDEPLIAMEMESELIALGIEVVGPATHVASAQRMIAEDSFDAALIDANLNGKSAEEIAAALARKRVPFAFATGYGREALPERFRDAAMLAKPFDPERLEAIVCDLLAGRNDSSNVVNLAPR
jgi:PAS domain S-box-containing protein